MCRASPVCHCQGQDGKLHNGRSGDGPAREGGRWWDELLAVCVCVASRVGEGGTVRGRGEWGGSHAAKKKG